MKKEDKTLLFKKALTTALLQLPQEAITGISHELDFFHVGDYKSAIPADVCKAIKEFKTAQDQKIISTWINTTQNKNGLDEAGNAVVHLAILNLHPKLALWFFNKGVNINVVNKKLLENSLSLAIHMAAEQKSESTIRKNYIDLIKFLIENKADMEINAGLGTFKYALCSAAILCDLEIIKLLVEQGQADVNYSKFVFTPIGSATASNKPQDKKAEVVAYLQSKGAHLCAIPPTFT